MDIVVLAGGKGTRLRRFFPGIPKILVEIKGKSILDRQIENLTSRGFEGIFLSLGYLSEKVIEYLQNRGLVDKVSYYVEKTPMGTGGAIPHIYREYGLKEPFFVLNGDTLLEIDYREVLKFHCQKNSDITVVVKKEKGLKDIGSVELDEDSRVLSFEEKVGNKSSFINAGCYCFTFGRVKELFNKDYLSIECDIIPLAVKSGKRVYGFEITKGFYDFGTIEKIRKYAALIDK